MFKDLLNEIKGFKYQITVAVLLSKKKKKKKINSATKTVINSKYHLDKSFLAILYRIDNWINKRSGWMIESINVEYVNISIHSPLIGSTYIELPDKLKNSMKALINIKNNDNKCFLWCHIRHLNLVKPHPFRITKEEKKMINDLNNEGLEFPVSEKDIQKIERQNNICINVFCYENGLTYFVYLSDQKFDRSKSLSSLKDESVSEKDSQRANNIWNVFKINTMGDYHDLYLKTDVLLLADVFEKFIKTCLVYYGLGSCHYFRSSGISWDAVLKITKIELDFINEIDMHLFFEKGMTNKYK